MIINFQEHPYNPDTRMAAGLAAMGRPMRCFVDGVEVHCVWYADNEDGVVKSYDVLGDRQAHWSGSPEVLAAAQGQSWDLPVNHAASKTVRGTVDFKVEMGSM